MFAKYDLKYLADPKATMGDAESIHTMARIGLEQDQPEAYQILDNFHWDQADMESVMLAINSGATPQEAAKEWVTNNQDKVDQWLK